MWQNWTDYRATLLAVPERLHSLDVLRGVAVLAVMLVHWPGGYYPTDDLAVQVVNTVSSIGYLGVDLFFVLSGFLISGLLFDEIDRTGTIRARRFWLRRGFKIWPAYFIAYGALTVATALAMTPRRAVDYLASLWPFLVFVQNYTENFRAWPASWSLAIEEHFYLALPIVCAAAVWRWGRGGARLVALVAAGVIVAVPVVRLVAYAALDQPLWSFYMPTHYRADALAVGVVACYVARRYRTHLPTLGRSLGLAVAVAALAATMVGMFRPRQSPHAGVWGVTVMALAFGWLVTAAAARPAWGRDGWAAVAGRPLAWLGTYSYTVYLAHAILRRWPGSAGLYRALEAALGVWGLRAVYITASILAGVVLSHAVERPMLRARARWVPSGRREARTKPKSVPAEAAVVEV